MSDEQLIVESFSGVRGIYGHGLNEKLTRAYARVFALAMQAKHNQATVVIGADTRPSSEILKTLFIDVCKDIGLTVYDIGFTTTPVAEHAVRYFEAQGGVMITASHNEPEFNGWKFLDQTGAIVAPEIMEQYKKSVHTTSTPEIKNNTSGTVSDVSAEAVDAYIDMVLHLFTKNDIKAIKDMNCHLVVDSNGSAVWDVAQIIFDRLGIRYTGMRTELGKFSRLVEPNSSSLADVADMVQDQHALFGCGFDCDADRVELVLPAGDTYAKKYGAVLSGQYVLGLGIQSWSQMHTDDRSPIVVNFATSNLVWDIAKNLHREVIEVDVGEIHVVSKMREVQSTIGGEGSSSGVIAGSTTCRDGMVVILLALVLIARNKKTLSEIMNQYPRYYELREKVTCQPDAVVGIRSALIKYYEENSFIVVTDSDDTSGVKVYVKENTWIFFRASKTEPGQFRIIVNGPDEAELNSVMTHAIEVFKASNH